MNRIIIIILLLVVAVSAQSQINLNTPHDGNQTYTIAAPQYVKMLPGFEYKPESQNYLRAYIDASYIPNINFVNEEFGQRELNKSLEVGSIPGSLMVDMYGRANYSIPIHIPPGSSGLQPKINLEYTSDMNGGILGEGWSMNSISSIVRVGSSIKHDGFNKALALDENDRFEMDNSRLIGINGVYGQDESEYRTYIDKYLKIVSNTTSDYVGPESFIAENKDGVKYYYGITDDSKITFENNGENVVYRWLLSKVEDKQGNYITYNYFQRSGQYYLSSIEYTGNSISQRETYNSIEFNYGIVEDAQTTYIFGNEVRMDLLLSNINLVVENETVLSYKLTYFNRFRPSLLSITQHAKDGKTTNSTEFHYNPQPNIEPIGQYSLSGNFMRIKPVPSNSSCISSDAKTKFFSDDFNNDGRDDNITINDGHTRNNEANIWVPKLVLGLQVSDYLLQGPVETFLFEYEPELNTQEHLLNDITYGDFNGDGYLDFALALSTEQITPIRHKWRVKVFINDKNNSFQHYWVDNALYPETYKSNSPYESSYYSCLTSGDLNGDGIDEIILFNNDGNINNFRFINLQNNTSFFSTFEETMSDNKGYAKRILPGDFNGDNKDELFFLNSSGDFYLIEAYSKGVQNSNLVSLFGGEGIDIQNSDILYKGYFTPDSKTDIIYYSTTGNWKLLISSDNSFIESASFSGISAPITHPHWMKEISPIVADINGDGLSDIIDFNGNSLQSNIAIYYTLPGLREDKTLASSVETIELPIDLYGKEIDILHILDINGDGAKELLFQEFELIDGCNPTPYNYYHQETSHIPTIIQPSRTYSPKLLGSLLDGLNNRTIIDYKHVSFKEAAGQNSISFVSITNPVYLESFYNLKARRFLVEQIREEVNGSYLTTKYGYSNPVWNKKEGRFLGYQNRCIANENNNNRIEYEYEINEDLVSLFHNRTKLFNSTDELVNETTSTFQWQETYPGVYFFNIDNSTIVNHQKNTKKITQAIFSPSGIINGNITKFINSYYSENILNESEEVSFGYTSIDSWCENKLATLEKKYTKQNQPEINRGYAFEYYNSGLEIGLKKKDVLFADMPKPVYVNYFYTDCGGLKEKIVSGLDFDQRQLKYMYDDNNRFIEGVINPLGHSIFYEHEPVFGNVKQYVSETGLVTNYKFNSLGRLEEIHYPDQTDAEIDYKWDNSDFDNYALYRVDMRKAGFGSITNYYNATGTEIGSSYQDFDGEFSYIKHEYDVFNNLTRSSMPYYEDTPINDIKWTTYLYDDLNRITNIASPVSNLSYSYNELDITITDNIRQRADIYSYSPSGLLTEKREPDNGIRYFYNAEGKPQKTELNNLEYLIGYDPYGYQSSITDPDIGTINYINNTLGEVTQKTDAKSNVFDYSYDKIGRIISETILNNRVVTYEYDKSPNSIGMLGKVLDSNGTTYTYTYDDLSRLSKKQLIYNALEYAFDYEYNNLNQLSKVSYPNTETFNYNYNDYGHLESISNAKDNTILFNNIKQDILGRSTGYLYGNGLTTTKTFNPINYKVDKILVSDNSNSIFDFEFSYSSTGLLASRSDKKIGRQESFIYDNHDRLLSAIPNELSVPNTYLYSPTGNILQNGEGLFNYSGISAGPHAVTDITLSINSTMPETSQNIVYTPFDKVKTISEGNYTYEIDYDPFNSRVHSTLKENDVPKKSKLYFDSYEEVTENNTGTTQNCYLYGSDGLFAIHSTMANNTKKISYVHKDNLGSIIGLTDENGTIIPESLQSYDAFGNQRNPLTWLPQSSSIGAPMFDRGYAGHEHLTEFGLINMNGRCYDPKLGRFLSPDLFIQDPMNSQNFNRYTYCLNNPLNLWDPTGYEYDDVDGLWDWLKDLFGGNDDDIAYTLNITGAEVTASRIYPEDFYLETDVHYRDIEFDLVNDSYEGNKITDGSRSDITPMQSRNNVQVTSGGGGSNAMASKGGGSNASGQGGGVGQPGTWEGLIPIWGSGRAAVDHFQNGNYWRGIGYSALAISDVFLVKSIATAAGRGAWKVGAHSWSATRQWLGKTGYAEAGQPVHHWAISQATAKQYGIEAITNQPWNLMTFSNQSLHMRAGHGLNYLGQPGYGVMGQLWFGTPIWPKAVVGSYGGRLIGE